MTRLQKGLKLGLAVNLLSAFAMVVLSEEYHPLLVAPALPLLLLGLAVGHREFSKTARFGLTAFTLGLFALLALRALQSGDYLQNAVLFALYATVVRVLQLPTARQLFQAVALAFLLMIAGSAMNPDLSFALLLVPYALSLSWLLLLIHLKSETEAAGEDSPVLWKSEALIRPRLVWGVTLMTLLLLVGAWSVFLFFPRLGLGFFSSKARGGDTVSGFSDEVELGHFGRIETSDRVVLRVRFPGGADPGSLYLLGAVFDHYEQGVWSKSLGGQHWLPTDTDGFVDLGYARQWAKVTASPVRGLNAVEYEVFQEPLGGNRVLFTIPQGAALRPIAAELDRYQGTSRQFHVDGLGNPSYRGPANSSLGFTARSLVSNRSPADLAAPENDPEWLTRLYLQLPEDLDPRLGALARQAAGGARGRLAVTRAIEDHLLRNYAYSLDGGHNPADPLADFLFGLRRGHCEYFSSAMVLMLRTLGIPARSANGYRGGKFNRFGGFRAFAEAEAHSWVQVWFPGAGWQGFDPTPGGRESLGAGLWDTVDQWMDALRLQWYRWVIEYDLENQLQVYSGVLKAFGGKGFDLKGNATPAELKRLGKGVRESLFNARNGFILGGLVLFGVLAGVLSRRSKWRPFAGDQGARLERRVRKRLGAKGVLVPPHETLTGFGQKLRPEDHYLGGQLQKLGEELDALRWSTGPLEPAAAKALLRKVKALPVRRKR